MAFWCYIVRCSDGRYYTGHTDHLERRIGQHQAGGYCRFTSTRRPVELVWCQDFPTRLEALEAERRISPWSRKKKEALIASDWTELSFWAKPPSERPSTSLGTNGEVDCAPTSLGKNGQESEPVAPVTNEERRGGPVPFLANEIEDAETVAFVPSEVEAHLHR